jgi:hypothetical protein
MAEGRIPAKRVDFASVHQEVVAVLTLMQPGLHAKDTTLDTYCEDNSSSGDVWKFKAQQAVQVLENEVLPLGLCLQVTFHTICTRMPVWRTRTLATSELLKPKSCTPIILRTRVGQGATSACPKHT